MEALSFWLISIVQDEGRLTGPNYQTHHPVLRVKKSRISRGIITVRRPCDQEFYSIGCCERRTNIIPPHTSDPSNPHRNSFFLTSIFFKARRSKVTRSVFLMLIFCHETIQSIILSIILHLFISSFLYPPPPYFIHTPIFVKFLLYNSTIKKFKYC